MELEAKEISARLERIREELPEGVTLVAVSKTHPVESLMAAYNAGQRIFGENKVQEMTFKHSQMPSDVQWHFIGHVQRNKIKTMAPYVALIQGIGSYEALEETDRQAAKCGRTISCLLQLHIATEETKFGFSFEECRSMLEEGRWRSLEHISIDGVMGMASFTDNTEQVLHEFGTLKAFFDEAKERWFAGSSSSFRTISAGMSDDHMLAIQAGSNMVRIGSDIFGHRDHGNTAGNQ